MSDTINEGNNIFTSHDNIYVSEKNIPTIENDCVDTAQIGRCFQHGCIWINQTTDQAFICIKSDVKNTVWKQITT